MKSLRIRLAIWSGAITGIILLLYVGGDTYELYHDSLDYIDAEIVQTGERFLEHAADMDGQMNYQVPLEAMILDDREYLTILEVVSAEGVAFTRDGFREQLGSQGSMMPGKFTNLQLGETKYRIGTVSKNQWSGTFAVDFEVISEEVSEAIGLFLMVLPGIVLAAAIGGWWIGRMALNPIRLIAQTAEEINASELSRRLPEPTVNGEIARLVEVLNAMLSRLESSFQQASRFTADASHQLRTPLTVLQSEIDSALNSGAFGTEQQQVLMVLMEEVQRLKTIIESLLILSRSDAGNLHLQEQSFNLAQQIRELIDDFKLLGETHDLEFIEKLPDHLFVRADEVLLRQCFVNLLDNAVKYNKQGGRVECQLHGDPSGLVFSITNTGNPIDSESRDRVFERFFRGAGSVEQGNKGFGLGLSLVQEIIKAHGGSVGLDQSTGGQTRFTLILPGSRLDAR